MRMVKCELGRGGRVEDGIGGKESGLVRCGGRKEREILYERDSQPRRDTVVSEWSCLSQSLLQ